MKTRNATQLKARINAMAKEAGIPAQAMSGENAGAARPRLRQRAIGSLDSLHLSRGVGAYYDRKSCALYAAF